MFIGSLLIWPRIEGLTNTTSIPKFLESCLFVPNYVLCSSLDFFEFLVHEIVSLQKTYFFTYKNETKS